ACEHSNGAGAGYSAEYSYSLISTSHHSRAGRRVPTLQHWPGAGKRPADPYQPGLEHDLQLLPLGAHPAKRPRRGGNHCAPATLAALPPARAALLDDWSHLE